MVCFPRFVPPARLRSRGALAALAAAATLLLVSCGGGGGGASPGTDAGSNTTSSTSASALRPSTTLGGICTADGQKEFVRSYMDEMYLWHDEIPTVDASRYPEVTGYFDALRVRTPDAHGMPKDRFSVALTSSAADAWLSMDFGAAQEAAQPASREPVPLVKVVTSPAGRKTGYILFMDHKQGAQDALIAAFEEMRSQQVADLVLDMRYNSGGYLYIAAAAASMVAGPQSEALVFEQLRYSAKRADETARSSLLFSGQVQVGETRFPRGTLLPQLDLPRLYVLSSSLTCSASEAIINGLRGIGVEVVLVGDTTCGKPYGFRRKDNCGYAFFPIEFQGVNAKGFGDYSTGFQTTCRVSDDGTRQMGNPEEPLLAAALRHADTGTCPPATDAPSTAKSAVDPPPGTTVRPPWAGRLLAPPH